VFARMGFETQGKDLRTLVTEVLATLVPSRVLAPLQPAFDALKAKILELVHAFLDPVTNAVNQLRDAIDALDISFVGDELHALHQQIADEIDGLRPSVLLHDLLAAVDEAKQRIIAFDPLAPVREAVDAAKKAVEDVAEKFRPTVLFAPVLDAYDTILRDASGLDVRQLLAPILDALHAIEQQLDAGLDETATALTKLQAALP
jgi:tetrahydromethanopterin S-methyltransferase subunit B